MSDLPPNDLDVQLERSGDVVRLRVSGELDLVSESQFSAQLLRALAEDLRLVVVDLTGVEFIDSCGLRALLTGRDAAQRAGRELALAVADGPVTALFDIAGVRDWFTYE